LRNVVAGSGSDVDVACPDLPFEAPTQVQVGRQFAFGLRYSF